MSEYGFAGFPLRDSLPRGFSFVHMLRGAKAPPPASPGTAPATRNVAGGFDSGATERTLSSKRTNGENGIVRHDLVKQFSDGSRRMEVQHEHPDGTFDIATERRSLPDADGFQEVRVWARTTAPDGTRSEDFRVFRVPAGMEMDWDGPDARNFLLTSSADAPPADAKPMPDLSARPSETAAERPQRSRPVVPILP